jgi:hypothetical protein
MDGVKPLIESGDSGKRARLPCLDGVVDRRWDGCERGR